MSSLRPYGILLCAALLSGCVGEPFKPSENLVDQALHGLVSVVDAENRAQGLAVVVRVTHARVLLALPHPPPGVRELFLAFGEERVPTQVYPASSVALLDAPRAERDLRAVQPAKRPQVGEFVFVYSALPNRGVVHGLTSVSGVTPVRLQLLTAPAFGAGDDRSLSERLDDAQGGLVFAPGGGLIGVVDGLSNEEPEVRSLLDLAPELISRLEAMPGAERMGPADGFLTYLLSVPSSPEQVELPPVEDSWGEPDFFVVLEREERRYARVEVSAGRREPEPRLVWLPHSRGLSLRLVERDLTLTGGERERDMTDTTKTPLVIEAAPRVDCRFEVDPAVASTYPKGAQGPRATRLTLAFEELDPERESEADKTPLGARSHGLGRIASGSLDWWGGDATDFWTIDVEQGGRVLFFLYRDGSDGQVSMQAFVPGKGEPLFATDPGSDQRLIVASAEVPAGQLLVRVRQMGGPPGVSGYSVFLFPPAEGTDALFRTLLRLLGRQSPRAFAFLASKEFARQVHRCLAIEAGLPPLAMVEAVLAGLGDRMSSARHLALHLLDVHFRPTLAQLESVRSKAVAADLRRGGRTSGRRARDAALLLAQRCASKDGFRRYVHLLAAEGLTPKDREPASPVWRAAVSKARAMARGRLQKAVLDAARDVGDPSIRLRALSVASRCEDGDARNVLRRELRKLLENDASLRVRRALERVFPPEVEARQRRLRQRASRRVR